MEIQFVHDGDEMKLGHEPSAPLLDPEPLIETGRKWSRWLGPAISFAVLVAILFQMHKLNVTEIRALIPVTPLFWMVFFVAYFVGPVADWFIFRHLWNVPPSGFFALVRKQVTNALLPSYSGEVYFYAWARKRTELTGTPFGAIKDVAILSAVTGNLVTLAMLAFAYPLFGSLLGGVQIKTFALSIGFVTFSSLIVMVFRGRLFSLPRPQLWFVTAMVLLRILIGTFCVATMWHLIMPSSDLGWWLVLATIKLLLTRLPFVPNQDGLFASVAIALIGQDQPVTQLVAMVAIATLLTHIVFGVVLGLSDIVRAGDRSHA
jgi:hypothetical protein